ncbi:unnamed protein product [Timema podura]|uniref:Uncharacterized protein n=1 Tax=Timema podura TaxID=61482 RepID=A0ABN7PFS6_TIMPD|nr:unnamed protein product [Timema podura]
MYLCSRVPARDRDRRRDPRQDYYSWEYEDNPYYREQRSRPSSRSRPEYDDYRVRDYHAYSGYNYYGRQIQGYPYSAYYGYDLKYLEDLRRTNPVLYAEYYAKYLSPQAVAQGSYTEDRGSVHSGRSSANEERSVNSTASTPPNYHERCLHSSKLPGVLPPLLQATRNVASTPPNYQEC